MKNAKGLRFKLQSKKYPQNAQAFITEKKPSVIFISICNENAELNLQKVHTEKTLLHSITSKTYLLLKK